MSKYAELVEAEATETDEDEEAEEAEPEQAEPEEEGEGEPEAQAFPQIGPDEIKKAERAIDAQRKRLGGILGDAAVTHECVLCAGLGFLPDLPPAGTTFAIVLTDSGPALIAEEPLQEPPYPDDPARTICDRCEGLGRTLTGSKVPEHRAHVCSKCNGNGWVDRALDYTGNTVPPYATAIAPPPYVPDPSLTVPDAWGRAVGHPHYGVPPASIPG